MSIRALVLAISLLVVAPMVCSQAGIQDLLGLGPSAKSNSPGGVFKSAAGEWHLVRPGSNGLDCAMGFFAEAGTLGMLLIGPTPDGSKGTMLFMGAKLPQVNAATETRVVLVTDKDPPGHKATPIKAFRLPGDGSPVAIATDMAATLRGITDVKRVALKHNDSFVFDVATDGMFAARDALAQCMGMPRIASGR
jgi:hypothetical protein